MSAGLLFTVQREAAHEHATMHAAKYAELACLHWQVFVINVYVYICLSTFAAYASVTPTCL